MTRKQFEVLVEKALRTLPGPFKDKVANIAVVVEDWADDETLEEMGIEPPDTLYGLYRGVDITQRDSTYGNVLPDVITIYQGPIEEDAADQREMAEIVRETVMHELGSLLRAGRRHDAPDRGRRGLACSTGGARSAAIWRRPIAGSGCAPTASAASPPGPSRAAWPAATTACSSPRCSRRSVARSSWPSSRRASTYGGQTYALSTNRWIDGTVAPQGFRDLERFRLDGTTPVWTLRLRRRAAGKAGVDGAGREHDLRALSRSSGPRARWPLDAPRPGELSRLPRHHPGRRAGAWTWRSVTRRAARGGLRRCRGRFRSWRRGPRREPSTPGIAASRLARGARARPGRRGRRICTRGPCAPCCVRGACAHGRALDRARAVHRRGGRLGPPRGARGAICSRAAPAAGPRARRRPAWIRHLVLAADQFVVRRPLPDDPGGMTVIAGYPWFGDWGRDTMIALPGLALTTGRPELAARILRTFARFVDRGMLPNRFPDGGEAPEYNTVDATLWCVEAMRAYLRGHRRLGAAAGALARAREHRRVAPCAAPATASRVDPDRRARCAAGEPGVQLTWMDARVGDWVVTPRIGKPVEINALWYNALCAMAGFARALERPAEPWDAAAERVRRSFARFWNASGRLLLRRDRRARTGDDAALRPNQIFAVSLPASPLSRPSAAPRRRRLRAPAADLLRAAQSRARTTRRYCASLQRRPAARATAPITRAPCGPGCSGRSRWRTPACTAIARRRAHCSSRCAITSTTTASARSPRSSTARRRSRRAAARAGVERGRDAARLARAVRGARAARPTPSFVPPPS